MAQRSITRDVGPLSFRAMFSPSTLDTDKRTVQVTWTTGARVQRGGFFTEPFLEELSLDDKHVRMGRLQSGRAPLLDSHNAERVADSLGVVQGAQLDPGGKTGSATVRFDSGAEGSDAMRRVGEGTLSDISVGYRVHKMKKMADDEATKLPVYRAVDWEPHEMSLTPMGADTGAYARSEPAQRNTCEIIEEQTMSEPVITPPVQPAATAAPAALTDEQRRAADDAIRSEERERIAVITRTGRALGRPQAEVDAAIAGGTKIKHYQRAAIDARATETTIPIAGGGVIESGEDARDKLSRGMSAWLWMRSGVSRLVQDSAKARPDLLTPRGEKIETDPGEFRGLTLADIARRCLEAAGVRTAGVGRMEMIGMALSQRSPTATTSDFPIILENVLYKTLLAQYAITPDTWRAFTKVGSVSDFRANKRYRLGTFGSLTALNELGEFTQKSIPDAERQSITASTKGNLIGISRQAIINDDMGAFDTLAAMFGRAAALSQEVDIYASLQSNAGLGPLMSDGNTLFHATHNNISTGAAIGSAAIDADRVLLASQKDVSGNEVLALRPAILVLPVGLGGTARQINQGQYDFDALTVAGSTNRSTYAMPNRVGGLFREIVDSPRITVSTTRRYIFADPGIAPTFELAYVDGQAQPFMDQQQGFDFDGVRWKVRMDYGIAAIDFRGAVTNAGV